MKIYIKSAVNISDIQAKIAKKQAEIDKKKAWIQKKEIAINKKLDLLTGKLSDSELEAIKVFLDALKVTSSYKVPQELHVDTWGLARKYGYTYDDPEGKALYGLDDDAESIYNSNDAIKEAQAIIDKYEARLAAETAQEREIDDIPDCLKDFMNEMIDKWDKYDIRIRDNSKPYYQELQRKADDILYGDGRSALASDKKLADMYPDVTSYNRYRRFKKEYIIDPFESRYGSISYAMPLWEMDDAKIHAENYAAGRRLILDLLKRVTKITGPVRSWAGLELTRGNLGPVLNGVVTGEDGKARVESILAGGYNIQRLHVRTLVKPIR